MQSTGLTALATQLPTHAFSQQSAESVLKLPVKLYNPYGPVENYWKYLRPIFYDSGYGRAYIERLWRIYRRDGDPDIGEWVLQGVYLWWRAHEAQSERIKVAQIGQKMAVEFANNYPRAAPGHVMGAVFFGAEALSRGVLNAIHLVPKVDERLRATMEIDPEYMYGLAPCLLAKMYTKVPPFPMSIGDLDKAYEFLKTAEPVAKGTFAPWYLFRAEADLHRYGHEKAFETLARMKSEVKPENVATTYLLDSMLHDAEEFRRVMRDGTYNKYTWDPVLVPAQPALPVPPKYAD